MEVFLVEEILLEDNPSLITESYKFASEGEDFNIHCNGAGKIMWFYEKHEELPKSKPIFFGDQLHMHLTSKRDEGYYYCTGSSVYENDTITKVMRYSVDHVFVKILG